MMPNDAPRKTPDRTPNDRDNDEAPETPPTEPPPQPIEDPPAPDQPPYVVTSRLPDVGVRRGPGAGAYFGAVASRITAS